MQHFSPLDLQAFHLALLHFLPELRNHTVLVRIDSTVAAATKLGIPSPFQIGSDNMGVGTPMVKSLKVMHMPSQTSLAVDQISRWRHLP